MEASQPNCGSLRVDLPVTVRDAFRTAGFGPHLRQANWQGALAVNSGGHMEQPTPQGGGKAIASLVLGILGIFGWCIPIVGLPMAIVGLILGVKDLDSPKRGIAIAGIVLCGIGVVLSIVNGAIGAYLAVTGRHPFVNP